MQKNPSKKMKGSPSAECQRERKNPQQGKFECQQTEGNFRQRLLKSLEEFKEDTDYRPFNNEEMTREGDEMERSLEEIKGLRKKFRALHSNNRHSRNCPYLIHCLSPLNSTVFSY